MEILAEKIGMSKTLGVPSYAVTLLKVLDLKVCTTDGDKTVVAYSKGKKFNKAIEGQQKKYNLSREFNRFITLQTKVSEDNTIDLSPLTEAKRVKVTLKTKGRGFSGVVKKYGFRGGPRSHGSRFGRAPGSIGNAEFPGRVQKGQKMPGQYGNTQVSVKNSVVSFDSDSKIIVLKGSVPGANGNLARIKVI
jgi:large subunit ribosomal protein L3